MKVSGSRPVFPSLLQGPGWPSLSEDLSKRRLSRQDFATGMQGDRWPSVSGRENPAIGLENGKCRDWFPAGSAPSTLQGTRLPSDRWHRAVAANTVNMF